MTMKKRGGGEKFAKKNAINAHEVVDLSQDAPTFSNLDAALAAIRKRNSCAAESGGGSVAAAAAAAGGPLLLSSSASPKHPRPAFRRSIGSPRTGKSNADQQVVAKEVVDLEEVDNDETINKLLRQPNYFGEYETAGANLSSAIYISEYDDEQKMSAEELALKERQERRELEEKLAARRRLAEARPAAAAAPTIAATAPKQPVQSSLRRHPRRTAQEIVNNARNIPCVPTVATYDRSASTDKSVVVVPILKKRLHMAISTPILPPGAIPAAPVNASHPKYVPTVATYDRSASTDTMRVVVPILKKRLPMAISTPIFPPAAIPAAPVNASRSKRSAGDTGSLRRSRSTEMPPAKRRAATRPDDSDNDDDDDDRNMARPLSVQPPPQQLVPRESTTTVRAVTSKQRASGGGGDGSTLVGRWVEKWFKVPKSRRYRLYTGRVTNYDTIRQYYRVIYEDGDREEMTLDQLTEFLVSEGKKTS
jgi:hypothetical protein